MKVVVLPLVPLDWHYPGRLVLCQIMQQKGPKGHDRIKQSSRAKDNEPYDVCDFT